MKYKTLWDIGKGFLMLTIASLVVYGYEPRVKEEPAPQTPSRGLHETSASYGGQRTMTAMFQRGATSGGTTGGGFQ